MIDKLRVQNLHFGKCVGILPHRNRADFEMSYAMSGKFSLGYDYLVLAVGSVPNTFGIPGAETCKFLKTYDDMINLRRIVKNDDPDSINIIGAGPTGVELALALAQSQRGTHVRLIEAAKGILGGFSKDTKAAVMKELEAHSLQVELGVTVSSIDEKYVIENGGDKKVFPNDLTVWTSGVKPSPLVESLTGIGCKFTADSNFLVKGYKNIYAIGDLVASRELGPPTAQNARAQGVYLAEHFNGGFAPATGYTYKEKGKILHGADKIYVEYNGGCYTLPKSLGFIVDWITAP
jgi:NADH dehydrogenase FAD-containing subunit